MVNLFSYVGCLYEDTLKGGQNKMFYIGFYKNGRTLLVIVFWQEFIDDCVRREINGFIKFLRSSSKEEILSESSSVLLVEERGGEKPLSFVAWA